MTGLMVLVGLAKMTKDDIRAWFEEHAQDPNSEERIEHLRCEPGKWCRLTTEKWTFSTLSALHGAGFAIPGYLMQRPGWEPKRALLAESVHVGAEWILVTSGVISKVETAMSTMMANSDFEMFLGTSDGDIVWWTPNPKFESNKGVRIQSMQITFDREKKGHDGTERTAPYKMAKKNPIIANEIPLVSKKK